MCKCTPEKRTPFCGKPGCEWPPDTVVGHKTLKDGRHIPLFKSEADEIMRRIEHDEADRAARMPDEQSAINAMFDAWVRLRELGWREAIYCPKDGSTFKIIEPGSTGIFTGWYTGQWPDGHWWLSDDDDCGPSYPILFKLFPEAEEMRRHKLADARRRYEESNNG